MHIRRRTSDRFLSWHYTTAKYPGEGGGEVIRQQGEAQQFGEGVQRRAKDESADKALTESPSRKLLSPLFLLH